MKIILFFGIFVTKNNCTFEVVKKLDMLKDKEYLNLLLLNIGVAVHYADWNWKSVNSPFTRLYYVRGGSANLWTPDGIQKLIPNHLYMVPAFTTHSYECNDYFCLCYIHIYEDGISILEQYNYPVEISATALDASLIDRLLTINPGRELNQYDPSSYDNTSTLLQNIAINAQRTYYSMIETQGILLQLLSRFLEFATDKMSIVDNRIEKSITYIRKNISSSMSTGMLAEICFLSEDHFIRLFKREFDQTPLQYINQKKIERAQLILTISSLSIKDIAYGLSFDNLSYFNRVFKKITGCTPSQYQEKMRVIH
jgi:AraC-like DNA-binding protein